MHFRWSHSTLVQCFSPVRAFLRSWHATHARQDLKKAKTGPKHCISVLCDHLECIVLSYHISAEKYVGVEAVWSLLE